MTRSISIIPAFSAGIISPHLDASNELERYPYGLRQCENMIIDPLGGVKNCPGTEFTYECFDTEKKSRLIPFQFNVEQGYMLEFSHLRMRVYKDKALVFRDLVDASDYKWTLSGSGTSEYYVELLAGGDPGFLEPSVVLEDGSKMVEATVGSLSAGEWDYGDNDTLGYSTIYVRLSDSVDPDTKADGYVQAPVLIATPFPASFGEEFVQVLDDAQSTDTMYLTSGEYKPYKLTRTSEVDWVLTAHTLTDGPYLATLPTDIENIHTVSGYSGGTLTVTSKEDMVGAEVGKPFRLGFENPLSRSEIKWSWGTISSIPTSKSLIIVPQPDVFGNSDFGYDLVINAYFKSSIDFWEDRSISTSAVTHDLANELAVITKVGANEAEFHQQVPVQDGEWYNIEVTVDSVDTGINLRIGTTRGAQDVFATTLTAPGTTDYDFAANDLAGDYIWITFYTLGYGAGVTKIDEVHVRRKTLSTPYWRMGAFGDTSGWPKKVLIDGQRLLFANNTDEPQNIWPSKLGDFEYFGFNTPGIDTDSFSITPPTPQINGIDWMVEHKGMKVGTADSVWMISSATNGGVVITPTDVNIEIDGGVGSLPLYPIIADNSLIITPRGHVAVSEATSSTEAQGYAPKTLSYQASHLFENRRIVRWAYAKSPDSIIWCVLDDGTLLGMTYVKELNIWAWFKRTTPLGVGFVDVSVIPNSFDKNIDDVYFVINRAEDGETPNYYIETLNKRITPQTAAYELSASGTPYDYRFLDSAFTHDVSTNISGATKASPVVISSTAHGYSNGDLIRIQNVKGMTELNDNVYKIANKAANTYELNDEDDNAIDGTGFTAYITGGEARKMETVISGLDHLEGESVYALADGVVRSGVDRAGLTVSSGSITLPSAASFVHVGLSYESLIETLDIEVIMQETGSTQGRIKSVTGSKIYFKDTRGAEVSVSSRPGVWHSIAFNDEAYGEAPPPLFTGSKEKIAPGNYRKEDRISIRQADPLPIYIKRIIPYVDYGG